ERTQRAATHILDIKRRGHDGNRQTHKKDQAQHYKPDTHADTCQRAHHFITASRTGRHRNDECCKAKTEEQKRRKTVHEQRNSNVEAVHEQLATIIPARQTVILSLQYQPCLCQLVADQKKKRNAQQERRNQYNHPADGKLSDPVWVFCKKCKRLCEIHDQSLQFFCHYVACASVEKRDAPRC